MKFFSFLLSIFISLSLFSQTRVDPNGENKFKAPAIGHVYGKIVDSKTKEAIPFASVVILKKDSVAGGNLTKINGEFNIENLPFGKFNLKINFIGYKVFQQPVMITPQNVEQDLGDIKLEVDEKTLKTVEVTEEKSAVQMNIDRKVFNVDKDITSRGGTAADVMKSIPSVTLDDNGNAELRQKAVTIYVDGKPTTLTLDQIPADQIDRVEVISNPSAKFEASTTGGIINIVMKSNNRAGYNGVVSGGYGTNDHYNALVALNIKQKPIGISINYTCNGFQNPLSGYTHRTNFMNGATTGYFNSTDNNSHQHFFQTGSIGFDYYLNNRNTLTLSENMVSGNFHTFGVQNFQSSDASNIPVSAGSRTTDALSHFENYTTKLHYKKTFPRKGEELSVDANYNTTFGISPGQYRTTIYANGVPEPGSPQLQKNDGLNKAQMFLFQLDYVRPINDSTKLELGMQSNFKPSDQSLMVSNFNSVSGEFISDQYLSSHYRINDLVNGSYVNYSMRHRRINYMLGLRFEDSYYKGDIAEKNFSFTYSYPSKFNNIMNALFPAVFISKKFGEKKEIQFNVSRKLNRPNFRQLMPFIQITDKQNYTTGNPNLTPEFITLAEINYSQQLSKGNIFLTMFYRNTQNPLTSYSYTSPVDSSVLITTTVNGTQSNTFGMDDTFKYTLFKGFEATLNLNLFYTIIDASFNNSTISNQGFSYNGKLNLVYHMPKGFSVQMSGNYESPRIIPQGTYKSQYFSDFGLSKEISKMITATLSVRDVFDTKGRRTYLATDQYTQDSWNRRESRFVKLIVLVRFGKADASFFKRRQNQSEQDGGGDF